KNILLEKYKKENKEYRDVYIKQNELLNIYRETVSKYESILNGNNNEDQSNIIRYSEKKSSLSPYELDDILHEISEIGINNISPDKMKFLKNYNKWK
ncbi:MAG: hypothetical protein ACOC3V_00735, partial [bacterium]